MSDQYIRRTPLCPVRLRSGLGVLLLLSAAACGGASETPESEAASAPSVPQAGPPLELPELTDAELLGTDRERIVLAMPWTGRVLARDPARAAARATLRSVEILEGPGFDRASFTFGTDAPFPGYRIVWNDARAAMCGGEAGELPGEPVLLVSFDPATGRDDRTGPTVPQRSLRPGLPAVARAAEICDRTNRLTWALTAADSTTVRIVELRSPPQLLVDVRHAEPSAP